MIRLTPIFLLVLSLGLTSCKNWWNAEQDPMNAYRDKSSMVLYQDAKKQIQNGQYASASKTLEALETLYPFSPYAEQSQLDLIYAYYKNEEYPLSAAAAERFIHLYPRGKNVDYAYYMKGLANFQQPRGVFAKWLPMDESKRDPGTQIMAYSDFGTLVQRFPNSKYKANALQRMIYLRNMFAQRELNAAHYFYDRKMYVASAERASFLIRNYPQAPSAQKALILLKKSNLKLGLNDAAKDTTAVYQETYFKKPMPV